MGGFKNGGTGGAGTNLRRTEASQDRVWGIVSADPRTSWDNPYR